MMTLTSRDNRLPSLNILSDIPRMTAEDAYFDCIFRVQSCISSAQLPFQMASCEEMSLKVDLRLISRIIFTD